ncbi:MAG: hypothetical protein JOZ72_15790 [Alphaproteobacteria bacterium]|nr:hypothetical protein [Alphaproteobacteria bacterium]
MKRVFLTLLALAASTSAALAQVNAVKGMANALHGTDDLTPCHKSLTTMRWPP